MTSPTAPSYSTLPQDRIISIDMLRGLAVLGILILNIQSFSMPFTAYINPTAFGDLSGINKWVWIVSHMVGSEKFMSIFSILFGAGIILLYERKKEQGKNPGRIHYYRNFWLLIFGLLHAYLLWFGDILVAYSLCAFLVYLFRKMKPKGLIIVASFFFIIPVLLNLLSGLSLPYWPEESVKESMKMWLPARESINTEITAMRGSFSEQMAFRGEYALFMQTFLFFFGVFWRVTALMLLGIALFKSGVLSGQKSRAFYRRMAIIGLVSGYSLCAYGVYQLFEHQWSFEYGMFLGHMPNYFASVAVAFGYIGIILLIAKSNACSRIKKLFSSIGKMAFSNYILMSIIGSFLFYGHGLGLFGQVERIEQVLIVFVIWLIILLVSPLWLKNFNYGPIEWLWRTLTYSKALPFKKSLDK
ncbi:MAG: DUF418 domain-containing protein [Carboxylicivirga sp.]|jgi:uncharacterized protein|nr:DUF418 domain-containing protein [Carboxylicivirga sp.]